MYLYLGIKIMFSEQTKSIIVKVISGIVIATIVGLTTWMYTTVDTLQNRVTIIEINSKENLAQWRTLKKHDARIQEREIQTEVINRLFNILINQNNIKVDALYLPKPQPPAAKRTLNDFKEEQMQFNQRQQAK